MSMTLDDAITQFRHQPQFADLVRDAYFDLDPVIAARRFAASGEFAETLKIAGNRARRTVLDIGAGRGIASYAFAQAGAKHVWALEPDFSEIVGLGALLQVIDQHAIVPFAAYAEHLPLPDASCDLVYARQVLHHIPDLRAAMHEVARVLKCGGMLIACREHVVDNEVQLEAFLEHHPVHQLAGGENAYTLDQYTSAIIESGLHLEVVMRPWDSVITAFPAARTAEDLNDSFIRSHRRRNQIVLKAAKVVPGLIDFIRNRRTDPGNPGRLFAFVATKS
jgi:SAM-dependent methyltransferase